MMFENYEYAESDMNIEGVESSKPAFGYYGAKQKISKKIIELFPPHNAWVEVFCGSAAITLAKKPAQIEIINDLDSNIVNIFDQLRNNHEKLLEAIKLTPYSREEFHRAKIIRDEDDELERARKFLITCMMTVNGTVGNHACGLSFTNSYSRNDKEARVNRWNNLTDRIDCVVNRIKNVRVEHLDARRIVQMFSDRPATLMYLDPPYFVKRSHNYVVDEKEGKFHKELLEFCCKSKAMIMVSHYENSLYRKYLNKKNGWTSKTIITTTRDTSGVDFSRNEIVWMNSSLIKARMTKKIPIRLSASEIKNNKVNPPRK